MNKATVIHTSRTRSEREKRNLLHKVQTNLYWLATEVLGYDLLTEDFHKPMLQEWDERRLLRKRGKYRKYELEMWARDHYKTTCRKAQIIQDYACNPEHTHTIWHAVEDMAVQTGVAVGHQLQHNKELRKILPTEMLPPVGAKQFVTAKGFRLPSNRMDDAPSMRMWGAGSEATGGHSIGCDLDDIIGLNTILDNLMPKIRKWFGATVLNVIRTDIGFIRATGTRWADDDIYRDWIKSNRWDVRVRAFLETDGVPDWKGKPVLYSMDDFYRKKDGMSDFEVACQLMNDPLPEGTRLWQPDKCEHFVSLKEAAKGRGRVFVFGDPAPAQVGSFDQRGEKERADASKDYWSWAVVRIRVNGNRREFVLLDGTRSREWGPADGWDEGLRLCQQWNTNLLAYEAVGQAAAFYEKDIMDAGRRNGISVRPLRLKKTYFGKNAYFADLASKANRQEFFICESCNGDFLYGDKDKTGFLTQSRKWVCLATGRNGLRFDDDANVVSFCTDPVVDEHAPRPFRVETGLPDDMDPYGDGQEQFARRTRYCA